MNTPETKYAIIFDGVPYNETFKDATINNALLYNTKDDADDCVNQLVSIASHISGEILAVVFEINIISGKRIVAVDLLL